MQKIIIDNFRQIKHAEIEVKDFLLFIGEQASGKSTIAKLIYFFKSLKRDYVDIVSSPNEIIHEALIHQIQDKFAMYFGYASKLDKEMSITYYYDVNSEAYLKLGKANALYIKFEEKFWNSLLQEGKALRKSIMKSEKMQLSSRFVSQKFNDSRKQALEKKVNKLFHDAKECLFIPAGRNITVSYPEQFQLLFFGELKYPSMQMKEINTIDINLIKTFVSYSKFLADYFASPREDETAFGVVLNNIIHQILHGDYKNENGQEKIVFSDKEYVPLNVASSGQQESIRLIQDAMYIYQEQIEASRIIEEPEAHLFPRAQQIMIELLLLVANKTQSQIILTTHSPHVLAEFNNLLYCTKVLKEHPEKKTEIEHLFGVSPLDPSKRELLSLDPSKFQAYSLHVGDDQYCKSILDENTCLIGENTIDQSSEKINDDFDNLYQMM